MTTQTKHLSPEGFLHYGCGLARIGIPGLSVEPVWIRLPQKDPLGAKRERRQLLSALSVRRIYCQKRSAPVVLLDSHANHRYGFSQDFSELDKCGPMGSMVITSGASHPKYLP